MSQCPMKIAAWLHNNDGIFQCSLDAEHDGDHDAIGLSPDQHIHFQTEDRRVFVGGFVRCLAFSPSVLQCVLPIQHAGTHAF